MEDNATDIGRRRLLAQAIDCEDRSLARKENAIRSAQRAGHITSHEADDMLAMAKLTKDIAVRAIRGFAGMCG